MKSTTVLLALSLLYFGAQVAEGKSWGCWTANPLRYFHGWVRHGDSCPGIYGCDASSGILPYTQWNNVGFESMTGARTGPGNLRNDETLACAVWNTIDVSPACSRWAVKFLIQQGWNSAYYSWTSARPFCDKPSATCAPQKSNVCWVFQCNWYDCAIKKCPMKIEDDLFYNTSLATTSMQPNAWTCSLASYGDGVCDCNCGAWDIDCENLAAKTTGCAENEVCLPPGNVCHPKGDAIAQRKLFAQQIHKQTTHLTDFNVRFGHYAPQLPAKVVPADWTCPKDYYNANDGCDCECGAPDPDCAKSQTIVLNCDQSGYDQAIGLDTSLIPQCNTQGKCVYPNL